MKKWFYCLLPMLAVIASSCQNTTGSFPDDTLDYPLEISVVGEGTVTEEVIEDPELSGDEEGVRVRLRAYPADGWRFLRWEEDLEGKENPDIIVMENPKKVVAHFGEGEEEPDTGEEAGESEDEEDGEPGDLKDEDGDKTDETRGDDPDDEAKDESEEEAESGEREDEEKKDDEEKEDEDIYYSLTVDLDRQRGSIEMDGEHYDPDRDFEYKEGSSVEIRAFIAYSQQGITPLFTHWGGDTDHFDSEVENPMHVLMESDITIYSNFENYAELRTRVRSVDGEPGVGGGIIIHTDPEREGLYRVDQEVTAEAVPDEGWEFVEWDLTFSGSNNPTTQSLSGIAPIEAVFKETEPVVHAVEIDFLQARNVSRIFINGAEYFPENPASDYEYEDGTTVEIEATPAPMRHEIQYIFQHWGGSISSDENPLVHVLDSDLTIYPVFGTYVELRTWTRSVDMESGVGGEVIVHTAPAIEESGLYEIGQEIRVEAIAEEGWEFVEWDLSFSGSDNPSIQTVDPTPGEAVFREVEE